jgi:hypothetical protein
MIVNDVIKVPRDNNEDGKFFEDIICPGKPDN